MNARAALSIMLLTCTAAACRQSEVARPVQASRPAKRCHYDVKLTDARTGQLEVEVRCEGGMVRDFVASESVMAKHVTAQHASVGEITRRGDHFAVPEGAKPTIRYQVNLDAVALDNDDIDIAHKSGAGWVAAASTWLLQPEPSGADTLATVHVDTSAGGGFATGMTPTPAGHYVLKARRIPFATYGIFGEFESRELTVPGPFSARAGKQTDHQAQIQLVVMPGELSVDIDDLQKWLREAALAVGDFWAGFPVDRVCVVMVPTPGYARVAHGKVVSAGGPTVALQLGGRLEAERLHNDWILVHELFHLGFPTFPYSGKWLDEGLATYYEPIIRTRVGWRSEEELWQELAYDMPQGLPAMERHGLENAGGFKDIYWGGAAFAFVADLQIRQRSDNRLALEDGLRAVLAKGGHAGTIWTVDEAVAAIDGRLEMPVVGELLAKHRRSGHAIGFDNLLRELGVRRENGSVALDNGAPRAQVRQLISAPRTGFNK